MKKATRPIRFSAVILLCLLLLQAVTLILASLPSAVILQFAPGPGERAFLSFSYFDLTPFGYGNFFPILTLLLVFLVILLCVIGLIRKQELSQRGEGLILCHFMILVLSLTPLFPGSAGALSLSNCGIAVLALLSIGLLVFAKLHLRKT